MKERLQKIISARGVASRRKAEELILAGQVTVNGSPASLGDTADPETDEIRVAGQPLPSGERHVYILLNKPRGYVTTLSDEKGRPNVTRLVADCGVRVYPVGRLDMDSEGLLLLTNDGELAHDLLSPKKHVDKVYYARVSGTLTQEDCDAFAAGMTLDDGLVCREAGLEILRAGEESEALVTLHEGKFHQIKRMLAFCGKPVLYLKRLQMGPLILDKTLAKGEFRLLSGEEIAQIIHGQNIQ